MQIKRRLTEILYTNIKKKIKKIKKKYKKNQSIFLGLFMKGVYGFALMPLLSKKEKIK